MTLHSTRSCTNFAKRGHSSRSRSHATRRFTETPRAQAICHIGPVTREFGATCWRRYDHRAGKHLAILALGDQVSDAIELAGSAGLQSHHMVDTIAEGRIAHLLSLLSGGRKWPFAVEMLA